MGCPITSQFPSTECPVQHNGYRVLSILAPYKGRIARVNGKNKDPTRSRDRRPCGRGGLVHFGIQFGFDTQQCCTPQSVCWVWLWESDVNRGLNTRASPFSPEASLMQLSSHASTMILFQQYGLGLYGSLNVCNPFGNMYILHPFL